MDRQYENDTSQPSEDISSQNDVSIHTTENTSQEQPGILDLNRRGFMGAAGLAAVTAAVGMHIPFGQNLRNGFLPAAHAAEEPKKTEDPKKAAEAPQTFENITVPGKDGLSVVGDKPLNAETPAHLLDDDFTPTNRHFIRNHGTTPEKLDAKSWTLTVDGLVDKPLKLTIDDLKKKFEVVEQAMVIECAGNGRIGFVPPVKGNQWTTGAVACSKWKGVRLADVLKAAGVKSNAIYTAHEGADIDLSGKAGKFPMSRGVPIEKAMDPHNLIAFEMNGAELHPENGAPLRLIIGGWIGSCSQKWLTRIWLRDVIHDGAKMTGISYKMPNYPVKPGDKIPETDYTIMGSVPVKSLITRPKTAFATTEKTIEVGGHAWAGDNEVADVQVSIDFGKTWMKADLAKAANKYAWQNWKAKVTFPTKGYYEVWARATDDKGNMQPFAISWNANGYNNNSMHRIAVTVS